jgi:hypothetical protein
MTVRIVAAPLLAAALGVADLPAAADTQALPSLEELERQGAVIGAIRVDTRNIFDLSIPGESSAPYRFANTLHVVTRPEVIRRLLLFKPGERVTVQKIAETERLLLSQRILHDAEIRVERYAGGVADLAVVTRDTWSLDLAGGFTTAGGDESASFGVLERNLLGTGVLLGFAYTKDADRDGTEVEVGYDQAFDGWTRLKARRGDFSDGHRTLLEVDRPFYAFDTRWAARAHHDDESRIDPIHNAGDTIYEYRHVITATDAWAGWSPGLQGRRTQRFKVGALLQDHRYSVEPGKTPPPELPIDHKVRGPFARYELVEDDFAKVKNFNRIERPEFIAMGVDAYVQVTRALAAWGSTRDDWLYEAGISGGMTVAGGTRALGRVAVERRVGSTAVPITAPSASARVFVPWDRRWLTYASLTADHVSGGGIADELLIGGDEGLRGYPSRYQSGRNRVLATVEQRYFTDWYLFRLIRVGAAAFLDVGRAWEGVNENRMNGGWLSDVGVGLRLAIDRTASDSVMHLDLALPLDRTSDIKSVQFSLQTRFGF